MPIGRAILVLVLLTSLAPGASPELRTLDGKTIAGELVSITDKEIVIRSDGKEMATPVEQVLQLDLGSTTKLSGVKYIDVAFVDDTLLHCTKLALKGKEADLTLVNGQEHVKVPLETVSYVLNDAQEPKTQQDWKDLLGKKRNSDILASLKEGELITLKGTFGDADAEGKEIDFDLNSQGKMRAVKMEKIHGLLFFRQPNLQVPVCKLLDTQGNTIAVSSVTLGPAGFAVTTPAGVKIEVPRTLVARLDYSKGKLTYLSDLEPAKTVYTSTEDKPEPFRRDKNLDDTPGLRLIDPTPRTTSAPRPSYPKGLAIHAYTMLEYDLGGEYREFSTILGVDELVGGTDGMTNVKIEGDGKELWSGKTDRKSVPQRITCGVKDVHRLRITVSSGDLLDLGRHVDLADAKVSK
jgi:hypothetical protein